MIRLGITAIGVLFSVFCAAGVAAAAEPVAVEPVFHDCMEGAGDDLKSVTAEDLQFPSSPPPTS